MAQELATEILAGPPASPDARMTYEEFLDWPGENQHVEWVDGKVVYMSPITRVHASVGLFLLNLLSAYVEARQLGAVLYEPFQMKTGPDLPGRAPDILFVAKRNLGRLQKTYLDGPADLVVEIISPGSRAVDRGEKFYEYEQGGVPEFWLIDPQRKQAEFHQLGPDGIYRMVKRRERRNPLATVLQNHRDTLVRLDTTSFGMVFGFSHNRKWIFDAFMRCPKCGCQDDRVIDSRASREGATIRRRRECLGCGFRYTTYEEIEHEGLMVIKRDGRREGFSKEKLLMGIKKACQKRPISPKVIEDLVEKIVDEIADHYDREVPGADIGERVMKGLRDLDQVAYVRFASVYRRFQEATEFVQEVKKLEAKL